ncbi:MAG: helix-turn-helix domain-containing protein [Planctomycetales bacterium]|nr:helix-turn-helix domain-containing protein [Planctomycetales bacterium]
MHRKVDDKQALSVGQVAKRWGIGRDRVRQLVDGGHLPGAFCIPSAGKYGETLKIPLTSIMAAEERWQTIAPPVDAAPLPKPRRTGDGHLRHFPEFNPEHVSESPASE